MIGNFKEMGVWMAMLIDVQNCCWFNWSSRRSTIVNKQQYGYWHIGSVDSRECQWSWYCYCPMKRSHWKADDRVKSDVRLSWAIECWNYWDNCYAGSLVGAGRRFKVIFSREIEKVVETWECCGKVNIGFDDCDVQNNHHSEKYLEHYLKQ